MIRILYAEDNPINYKVISRQLERRNLKVKQATDGSKAYKIYKESPNKYDIILMDLQMPIMDGIDATQKIRELEQILQKTRIPIIALTANDTTCETNCLKSGIDAFIQKPINIKVLIQIIEKNISKPNNLSIQI